MTLELNQNKLSTFESLLVELEADDNFEFVSEEDLFP